MDIHFFYFKLHYFSNYFIFVCKSIDHYDSNNRGNNEQHCSGLLYYTIIIFISKKKILLFTSL